MAFAALGLLLSTGHGCSATFTEPGYPGSSCLESDDCDDGNPCTRDECRNRRCRSTPSQGELCSAMENCYVGMCDSNGVCVPTVAQGEPCDDGDSCTGADQCNSEGSCIGDVTSRLGRACDDGDPCTTDTTCTTNGLCQGGIPAPDRPACDEKDPCTVGNICLENGLCSPGTPRELPQSTCEICTCDSLWGVSCERPKVLECPCNLWGDVQFVDAFPDLKIRFVDAFPDLEIELIKNSPNGPGQWREVTSFPDFTVQVVESFPDLEIQLVNNPNNPCSD